MKQENYLAKKDKLLMKNELNYAMIILFILNQISFFIKNT